LALGEGGFPVSLFPGPSSPRVALGEAFPECNWSFPECCWHLGKNLPAVVMKLHIYVYYYSKADIYRRTINCTAIIIDCEKGRKRNYANTPDDRSTTSKIT
jgi:hypothetical protein